jgi:hypothetical protein
MKANEIRELLRLMVNEMAMIWCHAGFVAQVRDAAQNGADDDTLRALLKRAWLKSWWWMPELEPRVKTVLQ